MSVNDRVVTFCCTDWYDDHEIVSFLRAGCGFASARNQWRSFVSSVLQATGSIRSFLVETDSETSMQAVIDVKTFEMPASEANPRAVSKWRKQVMEGVGDHLDLASPDAMTSVVLSTSPGRGIVAQASEIRRETVPTLAKGREFLDVVLATRDRSGRE